MNYFKYILLIFDHVVLPKSRCWFKSVEQILRSSISLLNETSIVLYCIVLNMYIANPVGQQFI